ncbi:MAG: nucleotidyltransferase family protein, partial [Bacteroidaceae bacterium]|nr:nucleotidyltransferase family protein [Bacteroidaceae bacterium]
MDWPCLFEFASEHGILGVMFEGVQRLGEQGVRPPFQLLMDWVAAAGQIEEQNRTVNKVAVKFLAQLRQDGFEGCILKGQGNNLLYPNVYSRMSGDLDVWVRRVESLEFKVERNEELGMRNEELGMRHEGDESLELRVERNEELGMRKEGLGIRNEELGMRNE